jgi:hypothetical protein
MGKRRREDKERRERIEGGSTWEEAWEEGH